MNKSEMIESLIKCDEELIKSGFNGNPIDCYIAGGSAFILIDANNRTSQDIDVIKHTGNNITVLNYIFQKYHINNDIAAYFDNFPVGFAKRAQYIDIETKKINFYTLSLEDLVISKLCTTREEQDLEDITTPIVLDKINWDILNQLADSMEMSMISSYGYDNFRYHYNWYVKEYGPYEYTLD